MGHGGA
jgi:separase